MLQVLKINPRYFTDGSGKAVYLAGSHTWPDFKDYGTSDPPQPFDFTGFLDFLKSHNHNYIRLWNWELPKSAQGILFDVIWNHTPFAWPRTGPETASDGKPGFDLSRFEQSYFDRMRSRVMEAGKRGIYVAITLFDGYGLQFNRMPGDGFPFEAGNNINGISCGGTESQTLQNPAVTSVQEAYVKKVIDTVNDLDHVLYEIANESGGYSTEWQYHMIKYIKNYELTKSKQHPVGMSFQWEGGKDAHLLASPADWIAPSGAGGYGFPTDPPAADGRKVIINDTDHSFFYIQLKEAGLARQKAWVWKNFTRGNNVAFMDPYLMPWPGRNETNGTELDPYWETLRLNMGYVRAYAEKMDLAKMEPQSKLASTGYCLANPAKNRAEYIVYLPSKETVTLDLSASPGELRVEWFDPCTGNTVDGGKINGGVIRSFTHQFESDAVLYVHQPESNTTAKHKSCSCA